MDYIIDGYNFMFRLSSQKKTSLEATRNALIEQLNEELSVIKTSVTVVFDSSEQHKHYAQKAILAHLNVVYAPKGLTADEYIIELVENAKSAKTLTIVTSDSGLARQCQHLGTTTTSVDDFLTLITKKNKPKGASKPPYKEHPQQMERLRKIFEDRLKDS